MADNTTLNAGTGGDVIATDDIGGVKHQLVKIEYGAADSATQVSAANPLPVVQTGTPALPTGAATAAKQPALGTAGSASTDVLTVQGIASMTALKVDGSAVTQPVSAASLPLPSGAATAAKQPALGTAGSASSDVITVQGVASMTALKVDGSAVTQPVSLASVPSHAVTNAGTFAVQAAQTGTWTVNGKLQDGAGTALTSATRGAQQALSVQIVDASGNQITTFGGSGGTAGADAGTFTRGTTSVTPVAAVVESSAPTLTAGKYSGLSMTTAGELRVSISSGGIQGYAEDAAATSGDAGVQVLAVRQDTLASSTSADGDYASLKEDSLGRLYVVDAPSTAGLLSTARVAAAASTNATNVKNAAGQVYGYALYNGNAAARFVKFYNKASAPTVGTDTPVLTIILPAGGGANVEWSKGIPFATGISYAITGAVADSDTTAVSANDVHGIILYK